MGRYKRLNFFSRDKVVNKSNEGFVETRTTRGARFGDNMDICGHCGYKYNILKLLLNLFISYVFIFKVHIISRLGIISVCNRMIVDIIVVGKLELIIHLAWLG